MAKFNFRGWPVGGPDTNIQKPFDPDRLAPFHRISVSRERFPFPPSELNLVPDIDGKGYQCGCRSTKDYDGKIGEELARQLAGLIENVFPILKIPSALARGVAALLKKVPASLPVIGPIVRPVIAFLDDFDPFKDLLGLLGRALDALLVDSLIRSVPLWVVVLDEDKKAPLIKGEMEVEGVVIRSYQRSDSMPLTQWHHWYDWSFRVAPIPFFEGVLGQGNLSRSINDRDVRKDGLVRYDSELTFLGTAEESINRTIDCEWDLGLLGQPPGPFFSPEGSPIRDWAWPMTGQFFWAAGRSVYDGSHATTNHTTDQNDPDRPFDPEKAEGLHLNKLVPCKAIASARFEGHQFSENNKAVPSIQFMFLASNPTGINVRTGAEHELTSAGDFRFPALNDSDYEFIVDLPRLDRIPGATHAIGHTPEFPMNTIVLRPRLLVAARFGDFALGNGRAARNGPLPKVELLQPENPADPPKQAKVRIPLTEIKETISTLNVFGVVLSMGWHDPDEQLAGRVKKVTVEIQEIRVGPDAHDASNAHWVLNIGINGRWFQVDRDKVEKNRVITGLGLSLILLLSVDDAVQISAHGLERDGFGNFFADKPEINKDAPDGGSQQNPRTEREGIELVAKEGFLNDRLLRFAKKISVPNPSPPPLTNDVFIPFLGRSVQWKKDIEQSDKEIAKRDKKLASEVARAIFLRMGVAGAIEANDILGMIDPDVQDPDPKQRPLQRANDAVDTPNPLQVQKILDEVGPGKFKECRLTAYATDRSGRMGNLVYDPKKIDYVLAYRVKVEDQ